MTNRVQVSGRMLSWARERSRYGDAWFERRFPKLQSWIDGASSPTLKQLEGYAKAVHAPVGYLFLAEPPREAVPIPDFRTVRNEEIERPSPDLLDTIYICQQRQEWYRDFARATREDVRSFVGAAEVASDVESAARAMREALGFNLDERRSMPRWEDALRRFVAQAEDLGVLVMVNGVVGTNTHRKLDPDEFRGFALSDELAPLVFVNGADSKSAQMFTLAHELAHLWLGESALSDVDPSVAAKNAIEDWCNRVAAELLVPLAVFRAEYQTSAPLRDEIQRLARVFKVSTLVILRRVRDAGAISKNDFWREYEAEQARARRVGRSGGDFYKSQAVRLSPRFGRAVIISTLEGQTLYRDAFRLLGVTKVATFNTLGEHLGVL